MHQRMEIQSRSGRAQEEDSPLAEGGLFKSVFLPDEAEGQVSSVRKSGSAKRVLLRHAIHKNEEEDNRTIFVGNICNTTTRKEVKAIFKECGPIEAVRIRCQVLTDPEETHRSVGRGIRVLRGDIKKDEKATAVAYVLFANKASVGKALEKNSVIFNGRHIVVTELGVDGAAYPPETSVFLGNVAYDATEEDVWSFFALHGLHDIKRARLVRDRETGSCKGFGYVEFSSPSSVKKAIETRGNLLSGRKIRIVHANKAKAVKNAIPSRREVRQRKGNGEENSLKRRRSNSNKQKRSKKEQDEAEKSPWMGMVTNPRRKIPRDLRELSEGKR